MMEYLTSTNLRAVRLLEDGKISSRGEPLELLRHVVMVSDDEVITVDDIWNEYSGKQGLRRKFRGVEIGGAYSIHANDKHLATIVLAVELVKFIDQHLSKEIKK